jgi:hypothetical protein
MHKNATKCNKTQSKWCINKHGASKIIDTFETYQSAAVARDHRRSPSSMIVRHPIRATDQIFNMKCWLGQKGIRPVVPTVLLLAALAMRAHWLVLLL